MNNLSLCFNIALTFMNDSYFGIEFYLPSTSSNRIESEKFSGIFEDFGSIKPFFFIFKLKNLKKKFKN